MLRNTPLSVLALLMAVAGCARHTIPNVVLTPQTRIGPAEDFGPGIVEATSRDVDFTLDLPAYVIALRVTEARGVELIAPESRTSRSKRGAHYLRAEPLTSGGAGTYWSAFAGLPLAPPCAQPADRRATRFDNGLSSFDTCVDFSYVPEVSHPIIQRGYSSPLDRVGYWLLIVSDAPIRAREIRRRVDSLDLRHTSLVHRVHSIPEALIFARTTRWAAYYTPFGVPSLAGTR
jgi:hypothetical protein